MRAARSSASLFLLYLLFYEICFDIFCTFSRTVQRLAGYAAVILYNVIFNAYLISKLDDTLEVHHTRAYLNDRIRIGVVTLSTHILKVKNFNSA